ncbi:MAG: formyltransferase family protein [Nitrospirales bacterium]
MKNTLRFAYLNLKENPRGNAMLHRIIQEGHRPLIVIEEDSSLAQKNEASLLEELKCLDPQTPLPPCLQDIVQGTGIRCARVANHNDELCQALLNEYSLDVIVLGDTRIIRSPLLTIPNIGIINVHPGYLPDVRGNNPYIWAVYHDLPQGCSVHFIDTDIDTGPIILREMIDLGHISSFPILMHTLIDACGNLLARALTRVEQGGMDYQQQTDLALIGPAFSTFTLAPPEVKEKVKHMLAEGKYIFN